MDKKMFFLYDYNKEKEKKKKKGKKGTSSEVSKKSSDSSDLIKTCFSLREMQKLNTKELANKIFCLDEELTKVGARTEEIESLAFKDDVI